MEFARMFGQIVQQGKRVLKNTSSAEVWFNPFYCLEVMCELTHSWTPAV